MKKRYCCQVAVAAVIILFLAYHVIGAQSFSALQISELESQVSEGEIITISGNIHKKLRKEEGYDIYLEIQNQKEMVYVSLSDVSISENLKIGQPVSVTGEVRLFDEAPNPGNFNQKFYYQKKNIYVKLQDASVIVNSENFTLISVLMNCLWELQQSLADTVIAYTDERYGGILCAMLLNEDVFVDAEVKELLQKSGIGHLLAISGLHVSFIGLGLYKLVRKAGIPISISAILSSILLTFYILLIGGSTSAFRAWVMFLLQMGAHITGREYDGKTALAVAAMFVLADEPVLLFDAGFLLSFGAIVGIYVVAPGLQMKTSLAVQCILLPVQLYYYYEICPYSLLWNLLAIPASTVALGSGIAGLVFSQIPFIPSIVTNAFLFVAEMIIRFYEAGSIFVLELPFSRWIIGQPSLLWMGIYYVILIICIFVQRRKWMLFVGCAVLILGTNYPSGNLEIMMLNVGQGDSFFIQSPEGGTYLIDGGSSSVSKVGQYRIEPYLKMQGVASLDYVWVTHGDTDHVNGILELLERKRVGVQIENLILPPKNYWNENITELVMAAENAGTQLHIMQQGKILQEGEMQIRCLWPIPNTEDLDENQASIVLSLQYGSFDMLFTGDLEKEAEETVAGYIEELQKKEVLPEKYEVLKVGHHGSKYSTGEDLLSVVDPEYAWISAGENNLYGHPSVETLERLKKVGSKIVNTADNGGVTMKINERRMKIWKDLQNKTQVDIIRKIGVLYLKGRNIA